MEKEKRYREILKLLQQLRERPLSEQEWKQLERDAADDAFLSDALQGLRQVSHREMRKHLLSLEKRLEAEVRPAHRTYAFWYRAAGVAAVIVLMAASWLIWESQSEQTGLAENVVENPEPETTGETTNAASQTYDEPIPGQENTSGDESGRATDTDPGNVTNGTSSGDAYRDTRAAGARTSEDDMSTEKEAVASGTDPEQAPSESGDAGANNAIQEPSGKSELPPRQARDAQSDMPAVEIRKPPLTDGIAIPSSSARKEEPGQAEEKARSTYSLTEIVESEISIPNARDTIPYDTTQSSDMSRSSGPAGRAFARPVTGEKMYARYIAENLSYPQAARDAGIHGEVMLEFLLKPDGTPHEFKVVQSLGYGCDEEAIRLIREGPKWNVKEAQVPVGVYTVEF